MSILLDAGPSLNFLAVGQQNILIQIAQPQKLRLAAPARVDSEVIGMSRSDRFKNTGVRTTWNALKSAGRVEILPDELTSQQFADAVANNAGSGALAVGVSAPDPAGVMRPGGNPRGGWCRWRGRGSGCATWSCSRTARPGGPRR